MLPKGPYTSETIEPEMLAYWLEKKFFKPEYHAQKGLQSKKDMEEDDREVFSIINPPPNAYMRPHVGNVSGYAYQDVFLRFNRLLGKKVLGQPGKDHAGIQGEVLLEKIFLENKKKTKQELGREKFYKSSYSHFVKIMPQIMFDEQRIGLSSDYDRNLFTLDPKVVDVVLSTFIKMFKDNMIYKGVNIVNWDPVAQTTLADIDTERVEKETVLIEITYPLKNPKGDVKGITIATTRPETMHGDTAVIVNPKDDRYKDLVGELVILPIVNREIPIITSPRVDMEFGTGAVKLTPAHSFDDFVMMNEWNAEHPDKQVSYINVIDKQAKMIGPIPEQYKGMTTQDCRKKIIEDLDAQKLIVSRIPHKHNVMIGERSKAVVEQIMSSQWFIDVEKLKKPAIDVVKDGTIKVHPQYMTKKYLHWMENLHDWPVSRSLWWGYRIPVWYKGELKEEVGDDGKVVESIAGMPVDGIVDAVAKGLAKVQVESPGDDWIQDPDVLDTWFSSGQWPYATLIANELMTTFYPTDVMETAYDILELWVSRMIMLSLYTQGNIPFKHVYLHGLVKAPDGQKMSKSKGNVISPEDLINKYGADALRLLYVVGNKAGAGYPVSYEKLEGYKRFLNKIWNASRFILMNLENENIDGFSENSVQKISSNKDDQTLISNILKLSAEVKTHIEHYRLGLGAELVYQEFWHTFCDKYLEDVKPRIYKSDKDGKPIERTKEQEDDRKDALRTLAWSLRTYMIILHPFIPFITEKIWQELPHAKNEPETIMYQKWVEEIKG